MPIRVLVVEDYPVTRAGLREILAVAPDLDLVGLAESGQAALQQAARRQPDLILLDYRLPDMTAEVVLERLRAQGFAGRVLAFSAYDDEEVVRAMLAAGAGGYALKFEPPERIVEAIRTVARGELWFSSKVLPMVIRSGVRGAPAETELTERELEVLVQLAKGKSNPEIAEALGLAAGTVKNHITRIYDKLEVGSRAEAVAWAWRHGLVNAASGDERGEAAGHGQE